MKRGGVHVAWGVTLVLWMGGQATAAELGFGVVGGGTLSRIPTQSAQFQDGPLDVSFSVRWRTAFSAGVALEYALGQVGALRVEPRYVRQGTRFRSIERNRATGASQTITDTLKLDYLVVPVMLRTEFFKSKPVQFYTMSGIGPNFLLSAKDAGDDVKEDFKSVELGVISCAGVQRRAGGALLMLDLRIASSLTRIDKPQAPGQPKSKNTSFQITFGVVKAPKS